MMKEFYLKMANTKETQLNMARVGYAKKCHDIGANLLTCTEKESHQLIEELHEASTAYKELERDYNNMIKRYQDEALKDLNDTEVKENV